MNNFLQLLNFQKFPIEDLKEEREQEHAEF